MNKVQIEVVKRALVVSMLLALLSSFLYFVDVKSFLYRTSILTLPSHEPFNGTVYPVEFAPNFVKLTEAERVARFDELPSNKLINTPFYDPEVLKTATDDLVWGNFEHDKIRNAKIFYSVPYMGNYKLDGREYAGSHAAVDIKINEGTPIRSIANGVVTKVSKINSGFGHHVVVMHMNVPNLEDSSRTETLFSSYSHLSDILVNVGDTVTKGQRIAYSGNTGTSTTPHLHFQIDTDKAPWQPFWPFTWKEASDAGLNFWEAVNEGLGQARAIEVTVHPLKYVQKYMDESAVKASTVSYVDVVAERSNVVVTEVVETKPVESNSESLAAENVLKNEKVEVDRSVTEEAVEVKQSYEEVVKERQLVVKVSAENTYKAGDEAVVRIYLQDEEGKAFPSSFVGEMQIRSAGGNFSVRPALVRSRDFGSDGVLEARLKNFKPGSDRLTIKTEDLEYSSRRFNIVDDSLMFSDVLPSSRYFKALADLKERGIVEGYSDGTYKPSQTLSKVEAAKFIALAAELEIIKSPARLPFSDADRDAWYKDYVYTLYNAGVISGDASGRLDPNKDVNVAEFLKMLLVALDVEVQAVNGRLWYEPYVVEAAKMNIIDRSEFNPADRMTRGAVADAISRLLNHLGR